MVVSIDEEKNKEIEIPLYDQKDKRKLWISKVEIRHNTMMEKIRGLVQVKLFELVAGDDDFFKGIEDATIEIEDTDEQEKPESKEEILLAKKAQIIQDLHYAIMELPKDEILSFLTSSSLPTKFSGSSEKSPKEQPVKIEPDTPEDSGDNNQNDESLHQQQEDENYDGYNWILNCGDAWKDLPPVVRVNAIELGYNQILWDEDAQDLPLFRMFWKKLTPNQQTAAIFLGNYDEESWNEDARIMLLAGKHPSLESMTDEEVSEKTEPIAVDESLSLKKPKIHTKEDATVDTADTDMSGDRYDNDDGDDDNFSEFVSNFVSETIKDQEEVNKDPISRQKQEIEDEEDMMDEFLSNFAVSAETETNSIIEKNTEVESSVKPYSVVAKNDEDEDAMMDDFLSNFVSSEETKETDTNSNNKQSQEKEDTVLTTSTSANPKEDEGEERMMEEFLSNFVDTTNEDISSNSGNKHSLEKETTVAISSVVPEKKDEEKTMIDEFLENFVVSEEEDRNETFDEKSTEKLCLVPPTDSLVSKEEYDDDDDTAMMDEFLSNFVVPDNEKGDNDKDNHGPENESLVVPSKNLVPNYESVRENTLDDEDEEQPLISNPREFTMERGYQGEESPLLPTKKEANNPEAQKPDPPSSAWETVSSYLYWIPIIVGLPVVYMVANGSQE